MCLPTHNGEVVQNWYDDLWCWHGNRLEGGPEKFLEPIPKGPSRSPYVLLITLQLCTVVPVNYYAFLCDIIPCLCRPQGSF